MNLAYSTLTERKAFLESQISELSVTQHALKILANSGYGAIGNPYFRYFEIANAEAITLTGQYIIQFIEKYINNYLSIITKEEKDRIILLDTDSIGCTLEDIFNLLSEEENNQLKEIQARIDFLDFFAEQKLHPKIQEAITLIESQLNAFPGYLSMKRENIADAIIVTGKKHYIMNVFDKEGVRYQIPKKKIMGIESVKSSTPSLCRTLIKETIDYFFTHDNEYLINIIQTCKEKLFKETDLSLITFPRGVQNIKKYTYIGPGKELYTKGTPIHVRGALQYNKFIIENNLKNKYNLIQEGEKVKFAYLKLPNPLNENVIAWNTTEVPKELNLEKYLDYDQHFQIGYLNPIQKILDAIGWVAYKIENSNDWF